MFTLPPQNSPRIYLDNNSTTPLSSAAAHAMLKVLENTYGNPSSMHLEGQEARAALAAQRASVASALGVQPREVVFTATATEAFALLLQGLMPRSAAHIISSSLEHPAVLKPLELAVAQGHQVHLLNPGLYGGVGLDLVEEACLPTTRLIVLMAANNETGVLSDIPAIAEIAARRNIPLVVDLVAFFGKQSFSNLPGIASFVLSGHKIHGPKGAAAFYLRRRVCFESIMPGGGQEGGRRGGTENLAAITGFATALKEQMAALPEATLHMQSLRDYFERELFAALPDIAINGQGPRVPNVSNLYFPGVEGETLLMNLDLSGIAASHGSACASGALEPSHVLLAMGYTRERAAASLRFSLARNTTQEEIERALEVVIPLVKRLRSFAPRRR